jgi:hypothetical protein
MSIYEGTFNTSNLNAYIDSVKMTLINKGGFSLISDDGVGKSRVIQLSKSGFSHDLKLTFRSEAVNFSLVALDGLSTIGTTGSDNPYDYFTNYRLVVYNDTTAFFIQGASPYGTGGIYRCVFLYTRMATNSFQFLKSDVFRVSNPLRLYSQNSDNTLSFAGGFAKYSRSTQSGKQILSPIYLPEETSSYLYDTPITGLMGFPNSGAYINEGTKIEVNGKKYITSTYSSDYVRMLIQYD